MSFKRRIEYALCDPKIIERIRLHGLKSSMPSEFSYHPSFQLCGKGFSQNGVYVQAHPLSDSFISLTHISSGYTWIGDPNQREYKRHQVYLHGFEVSELITVAQWERVTSWKKDTQDPLQPCTHVNWLDAVLFCNAYSQMQFLEPVYTLPVGTPFNLPHTKQIHLLSQINIDFSRSGFRLPSELEWETWMRDKITKPMIEQHGNVIQYQEWCSDEYESRVGNHDDVVSYHSIWRSVRGGDASMTPQKRLFDRSQMLGYQSNNQIAFRIVRRVHL